MSSARSVDLGGSTDKQLAEIAKGNEQLTKYGQQSGDDVVGRAKKLLKDRKAKREKARIAEFSKEREETISLLKARPGRDSMLSKGSNNPFRL